MQLQKKYNVTDMFKLVMAFIVIGIHVGAAFEVNYHPILISVMETAVPFFFICSGFFLQNKIIESRNYQYTLKNYFMKILRLYILWHLLYLPLYLKYMWTNEHSFFEDLKYCTHMFLFVGEIYFSWPLWYLHGLLISIIIIYLLRKVRLSMISIWVISLIMMLIGYFISEIIKSNDKTILYFVCQKIVDLLGTADRNGPFRGFTLVSTGMIIRQYHYKINKGIAVGSILIGFSFIMNMYSMPFSLVCSGGGLFIFSASLKVKNHPIYATLRTHSILIYFMHMYFIVMCHMLFKDIIINVQLVYYAWGGIFFINWTLAIIIEKLRRHNEYKWLNLFIG